MIDPSAALVVGLIVGGTLGAMAAAVFSASRIIELCSENAELKAWKTSVLSGLSKATASRRAKKAAEKAKSDELHESMRAERRELVELI